MERRSSRKGSDIPLRHGCRFSGGISRRQLLAALAGLPLAEAVAAGRLGRALRAASREEQHLLAHLDQAHRSKPGVVRSGRGTTIGQGLDQLKRRVPAGRIGKLKVSRLILGGNPIGGWAHARDLIYASALMQAYHTREKVFETLRLAEACGINTLLTNPVLCDLIADYWKHGGGKIQFISDCGGNWRQLEENIKKSIDTGACACYFQEYPTWQLAKHRGVDEVVRLMELVRRNGLPVGLGAHFLRTVRTCVEKGLRPDFWMKTLHPTDYWSAQPRQEHDNIWCRKPEETIAYMKDRGEPWIAFKTLAAGAIQPKVGFKYAFEGGADFICVGMFDFQIVEDANIAVSVLGGELKRARKWCG